MSPESLLPYPKERALEDTALGHGLWPVRLFTLLLPIWQVDVRATTVEGKPYELIDRYLERGIAECGLRTVDELTRFFALDDVLVDRAIRFLVGIGHLTSTGEGVIALTDLGRASHRDRVRYVVTRQDRRKMYFDAYESRPLSRRHYDPGVVTFLTAAEVRAAVNRRDQDFKILAATRGFRREILVELANYRDREYYNLPHRLEQPESLREECVFLPVYMVRAMRTGGKVQFLAYGQAADTADPELSALCERTPEIIGVLANEETDEPEQAARIAAWLERKGLPGHKAVRFPHGAWRVVLPDSAFQPAGPFPLSRLASFTALSTTVVHVWCEDRELRKRALLARIDSYLDARQRQATEAATLVARIGEQLGFESVDLPVARAMATAAGMTRLVSRLNRLMTAEGS